MGSDVVVEGGGPSKGATTVAALERPVTGVSDHVVPQFWRLGKGLGAVTTLVRSETNKEALWSLFSMLASGSQHHGAQAKTFWWHFCSAWNFGHWVPITCCHRNKIHRAADTLIPKWLFFSGIALAISGTPTEFSFVIPLQSAGNLGILGSI